MTQDKIEDILIVYKDRLIAEDKGIVKPVLIKLDDNEFRSISIDRYPSGVYISRGYSTIDERYHHDDLFVLNSHYYSEEESNNMGSPRYWSEGNREESISQHLLVPIVKAKLPPVSNRTLPSNCNVPIGKLFFIYDEDQDRVYGPLTVVDIDSEGRSIIGAKTTSFISIGKDNLASVSYKDISNYVVNLNLHGIDRLFITSLEDVRSVIDPNVFIDYMSDSDLISHFNTIGGLKSKRFLARKEASKLKDEISNFEKNQGSVFRDNNRLNRIKKVLDLYLEKTDQGSKIIEDFFESSKGISFLNYYVEKNEDKLINNQIKKIEEEAKNKEVDINQKIAILESNLNRKKLEIDSFNEDIKIAREKAIEEINKIEMEKEDSIRTRLKEKEEILQVEIEELEEDKKNREKELSDILDRLNLSNDISAMNEEKGYLERDNQKLIEANKAIQKTLQDPEDLSKRMGELEIVSRVLRGGNVSKDKNLLFSPITNFSSYEPSTGNELIDAIRSSFEDDVGRRFSESEMANFLICVTQSFLTVLAGPPGVGKTSSVVRLAEALHLGSPSEHKNFLYMSAARGWVSGRDILGFYNSLNNTYQRARTGLFDFLSRPEEKADSLQLILLDEANLSPLEHYWSDFLGMCDKEGRGKPIQTGIPDNDRTELIVKNNVRFIATINHDSTTERLSPRLIDRVPIISLEHEFGENANNLPLGNKLDGAIDYFLFEKYFINNEAELSTEHKNKLNRIIELLRVRDSEQGQSINISYRKIDAITSYYAAAVENGLMDSDTAFDFSISQHILPHIEGYGPKFQNRLLNLKKELMGTNYPRSFNHLERILSAGSDFTGNYSFF